MEREPSDAISRRHSTAPPGPASSPGIAHLSLLHIAILAIVQGITEFLPISSSAHLILTWQALDAIGMVRSEEHTSELQSLMRISSADFCLKKTNHSNQNIDNKLTQQHNTYINTLYHTQ